MDVILRARVTVIRYAGRRVARKVRVRVGLSGMVLRNRACGGRDVK